MPVSISSQTSISLPFQPDEICYSDFSQTFFILNKQNNVILQIDQGGKILQKIGEFGFEKGQFINISDIATDSFGNLFVVDKTANSIIKFDERGEYVNSTTFDEIIEPALISVKDNGNLQLYDAFDNQIFSFDINKNLRYHLGKFSLISLTAIENSIEVNYALDKGNNTILVFDDFGGVIHTITSDERILDISSSKNFLYYIDSYANIFCSRHSGNIQNKLASLSDLFPIKIPSMMFVFENKIGIITNNRLHIFQLIMK